MRLGHNSDTQVVNDFVAHELEVEKGEKTASVQSEKQPPDAKQKRKGFLKLIWNRRQSSLIAGVLILVGLVLIAWFLITKPMLNLGVNIS